MSKIWVPPEIASAMKLKQDIKDDEDVEDCGKPNDNFKHRCCALCKTTGLRCRKQAIYTDNDDILRWCATHNKCFNGDNVREYHKLCDIFFDDKTSEGHYWLHYLLKDKNSHNSTIKDFEHMYRRQIDLRKFKEKMDKCIFARKMNTKACWTGCSNRKHEKFVEALELQSYRLGMFLDKNHL